MGKKWSEQEYDNFCSVNNARADKLWAEIDLKTFMAVLSLTGSPVSQTRIAESLNTSQMAVSRWMSGEGKITKKEWQPVLGEYLKGVNDLDLEHVAMAIHTLQEIKELYREEWEFSARLAAIKAITGYFSLKGLTYVLDTDYSGWNYDMIRFRRADGGDGEASFWYFYVVPAKSADENQVYLESLNGVFSYHESMSMISKRDRCSVVYFYSKLFGDAIKDTMRRMTGNQENQYRSLFLCDYEQGVVVEEMVLASGEDNS